MCGNFLNPANGLDSQPPHANSRRFHALDPRPFPNPSAGTPWPPHTAKGSVLIALPGGAWQVQVDHLRIDADGAPTIYYPDNTPGLDHPGNAGWSSDPTEARG